MPRGNFTTPDKTLPLLQQFHWTLDVDAGYALRGKLRNSAPGVGKADTPSPSIFTPITALCFMLTGEYYPSLQYEYAASEINMPPDIAEAIEKLSDCYVKDSPYYPKGSPYLNQLRYLQSHQNLV